MDYVHRFNGSPNLGLVVQKKRSRVKNPKIQVHNQKLQRRMRQGQTILHPNAMLCLVAQMAQVWICEAIQSWSRAIAHPHLIGKVKVI